MIAEIDLAVVLESRKLEENELEIIDKIIDVVSRCANDKFLAAHVILGSIG